MSLATYSDLQAAIANYLARPGDTLEEQEQKSRAVGMDGFLSKPVDSVALIRCLDAALGAQASDNRSNPGQA